MEESSTMNSYPEEVCRKDIHDEERSFFECAQVCSG